MTQMRIRAMKLLSKVKLLKAAVEKKLLENGILLMLCIVIGIMVFVWLWNSSLKACVRYSRLGL